MILAAGCLDLPSRPSRPLHRRYARERYSASSIDGPVAVEPAASAPPPGQHPLGAPLTALGELAVQPVHCPARHGGPWHRQGFRLYWRWRSRRRSPGRPPIDEDGAVHRCWNWAATICSYASGAVSWPMDCANRQAPSMASGEAVGSKNSASRATSGPMSSVSSGGNIRRAASAASDGLYSNSPATCRHFGFGGPVAFHERREPLAEKEPRRWTRVFAVGNGDSSSLSPYLLFPPRDKIRRP